MPGNVFGKPAADKRRDDHRKLNAEHVNLERIGAAKISGRIEIADLRRHVSLETACAEQKTGKREQETEIECHQEMAECHQARAKCDRARAPKQSVRQRAAQERRQINGRAVESDNSGSQLLRCLRAIK